MLRRAAYVLAALTLLALAAPASATLGPVEPFARYQPQHYCSPAAKPGTQVLRAWTVRTFGGGAGAISRACTGHSVSEHKEGRAFDWTLDATRPADRARAMAFKAKLFATGTSGQPAALARRMGVMYLIWNDHIYAAYDRFQPRPYLNAACKSLRTCSKTLRHRDHLHVSLTRDGGWGRTSWYAGRVPGNPTPTPTPTPPPTPSPQPTP